MDGLDLAESRSQSDSGVSLLMIVSGVLKGSPFHRLVPGLSLAGMFQPVLGALHNVRPHHGGIVEGNFTGFHRPDGLGWKNPPDAKISAAAKLSAD
jgi:hypothetical protein